MFFLKEAYGIRVLEIHFNQSDLLALFKRHGLNLLFVTDVFGDANFGHKSYLLEKVA
jgi:hypothetical protein